MGDQWLERVPERVDVRSEEKGLIRILFRRAERREASQKGLLILLVNDKHDPQVPRGKEQIQWARVHLSLSLFEAIFKQSSVHYVTAMVSHG